MYYDCASRNQSLIFVVPDRSIRFVLLQSLKKGLLTPTDCPANDACIWKTQYNLAADTLQLLHLLLFVHTGISGEVYSKFAEQLKKKT